MIMPNITPEEEMVKYNLYDRKTLLVKTLMLGESLGNGRITVGYGRWGDSKHFLNKNTSTI